MTKQPNNTNLGGIWIYNPPEPCGHTTDLRGVYRDLTGEFRIESTGGSSCVPDAWRFELPGSDPDDPVHNLLFGTHLLKRRRPHLRRGLVGYRLGWWSTDPVDIYGDGSEYYAWTLTFGGVHMQAGPYLDGFDYDDAWWLIAWFATYEFGGGFYGQTADYIYQFIRPAADERALALLSDEVVHNPDAPGSHRALFDGLGPNVFQFSPWHGALPSDAPGGAINEYLTVEPFYP